MQTRNIPVYLTQLISFNNLCKEYKAPINNAKDEVSRSLEPVFGACSGPIMNQDLHFD